MTLHCETVRRYHSTMWDVSIKLRYVYFRLCRNSSHAELTFLNSALRFKCRQVRLIDNIFTQMSTKIKLWHSNYILYSKGQLQNDTIIFAGLIQHHNTRTEEEIVPIFNMWSDTELVTVILHTLRTALISKIFCTDVLNMKRSYFMKHACDHYYKRVLKYSHHSSAVILNL